LHELSRYNYGLMTTPTIGILAGMGPHSTAPFLDLVLAECQAQYGARHDIDFPPIQILSWPVPFYADRPVDERDVEEATCRGLQRLAGSGVSFIGIACNTAHAFFPALERSVGVPLLDMVALTAEAAPAAPSRIALVAARPTVESGMYQRAMEARGHTVESPPWQDTVDQLIDATRLTERERRIRDLWDILAQRARDIGAEGLLLACADLTAVRGSLATPLPVLDSTRLLARGLVRRWLAERANGGGV
jgi:aspartate racemase